MSRPLRVALGIAIAIVAIIGFGVGYTLLVGSRPDIGNPDLPTVKRTLVGTWDTGELGRAEVIVGLTDEFTARDLDAELTRLEIGDPVQIRITFNADGTASAVSVADGITHPITDGSYRFIDNHTMVLSRDDCEVPSQFRLSHGTLTFGVIGSCPSQNTDLSLGLLLRSAPFTKAQAE